MRVTKFVHSCLLVEQGDKTALFDPGVMSEQALDVNNLTRLDDIFITHSHSDHVSPVLLQKLLAKFPTVRITSTNEVVQQLAQQGIKATTTPPADAVFFESQHESVAPLFPQPEQTGVHYLDVFSHPGDSHSFKETKAILALPVTAPWGSAVRAFNLALELQPKFVLPIHDWHWNDQARQQTYDSFENHFGQRGIKFFKLQTGQPVDIEV